MKRMSRRHIHIRIQFSSVKTANLMRKNIAKKRSEWGHKKWVDTNFFLVCDSFWDRQTYKESEPKETERWKLKFQWRKVWKIVFYNRKVTNAHRKRGKETEKKWWDWSQRECNVYISASLVRLFMCCVLSLFPVFPSSFNIKKILIFFLALRIYSTAQAPTKQRRLANSRNKHYIYKRAHNSEHTSLTKRSMSHVLFALLWHIKYTTTVEPNMMNMTTPCIVVLVVVNLIKFL